MIGEKIFGVKIISTKNQKWSWYQKQRKQLLETRREYVMTIEWVQIKRECIEIGH